MALTGPKYYGDKYLESVASSATPGAYSGWLIDDTDNSISKISGNQVLEKYLPSDPNYQSAVRTYGGDAARGTFQEYLDTYFPGGQLRTDLQAPKAPLTQAQVDAENARYDNFVASNDNRTGVTAQSYTDAELRAMRESGQLLEGGTRNEAGGSTPGSLGGSSGGSLGSSGGSALNLPSTGNPQLDATLASLENYMKELEKRGQVLNPNIKLDATTLAKFTKQAESEINPYYSTQLKLARENLLTNAGYSKDEVLRNEQELEKQYKTAFRQTGETAADQGFALSGQRVRQESELAQNTQNTIDSNRRKLSFDTGQNVRNYAQQFGSSNIPTLDIGNAPTITGGETGFSKPSGNRSLYSLDPNVYDGLVGSQQYEQTAAIRNRSSQLEEAFRSNQALDQQRLLTL